MIYPKSKEIIFGGKLELLKGESIRRDLWCGMSDIQSDPSQLSPNPSNSRYCQQSAL